MNGLIIVDKDKNMTSFDVCHQLMKIFNTKKIGHTGTLDPIATGVLVCTIGKYTKLNDVITSTYKEYIAEMVLGEQKDTYDIEGITINSSDKEVSKEEIIKVINSYQKKYEQEVPIYSSVKVNGMKLYQYARQGFNVELPKREVDIKEIEVLDINDKTIKFRALVSKGTYIRSLINDIGKTLGTYAYMINLRRTKQGQFDIKDSYTLEDIKNNNYKLLDLEDVFDLDIIDTDDNLFKQVNSGVKQEYNKEYTLYKYNGKNIALYRNGTMFIYLNER
jgi:tRNA pseudouridine55 synthase